MRPRQEIIAFNTDAPMERCLALAEITRYSRFPLCVGGAVDLTAASAFKGLYALRDKARTPRICCRSCVR